MLFGLFRNFQFLNLQFADILVFWGTGQAPGAAGLVLPDLAVVLGGDGDALDGVAIANVDIECVSIRFEAGLLQLVVQVVDHIA